MEMAFGEYEESTAAQEGWDVPGRPVSLTIRRMSAPEAGESARCEKENQRISGVSL